MKYRFGLLFMCCTILLSACSTKEASTQTNNSVTKQPIMGQVSKLEGIWQSNGYGFIIEIGKQKNRYFDHTPNFCLEEDIGNETIADFYDFYNLSEDGNTLQLWGSVDPYPYTFQKRNAVPNICNSPFPNTPINNLNAFVSYFSQHYAFFELYGVDWQQETKDAQAKVNPDTSDAELFEIMQNMLRNIKDGHVAIKAKIDGQRQRFEAGAPKIAEAINNMAKRENISIGETAATFHEGYWFGDVMETLLKGEGTFTANRRIQYGLVAVDIGYIALMNIGSFVDQKQSEGFDTNQKALDAAMEAALVQFKENNVKAVIIDLSINYGGYDYLARSIAGRFTDTVVTAYSKHAFDAPEAKPFTNVIEPSKGVKFLGPVYVLTSNITLSAGETTILSLRSLPNVTHIGEATRGALSDKLVKTLPNGWDITLSNEVYKDHQGMVWEGTGIQPHEEIQVFDLNDPMQGHVKAIHDLVDFIHTRP
ncbi:MAG: S41 family peptidase [Robiginitomaculum sp.]|nr:S41 family peptidase [Robiginitomaculum sp.]